MHLNSSLLFSKYALPYFHDNIKVLEIGPTGFPSVFQKLVKNPSIQWDTLDLVDTTYINSSIDNLTYRSTSPYEFPINDGQYDIILSGQVIEHVQKIWIWLGELKRVVKEHGIIITINPISWPYHEAPIDCWRIFPDGIKSLADECKLECEFVKYESLEVEEIKKLDPMAKFIPGQSYSYSDDYRYLNKKIRWNKIVRMFSKFRHFLEIPIEVAFDTISILRKNNQ
jgi:ubiquinone/menaquinone biosynthesis C-methylase UbiE